MHVAMHVAMLGMCSSAYLQRCKHVVCCLNDGKHGVGHGERMRPVVIRHVTVVLPHRQSKSEEVGDIKSEALNMVRYTTKS